MCGLLGVFGPAAERISDAAYALELLRHRGPDETRLVHGPNHVLGFQRLAVVDVADSHQPLTFPASGPEQGRYVIAFNGEIYNHRQLRHLMQVQYGLSFSTNGDAEVVVAAHSLWAGA